jgi:flagellum-specific ATP synthase
VLKSVSRTLPGCQTPEERVVAREARTLLSAFSDMEELIRIGAYRAGSDPTLDRAIRINPALEAFLTQDKAEVTRLDQSFATLKAVLEGAAA